ncbi:polysaccharide deacetylase family protein [Sphingomonadaceae bacterium OTU29THOMA1]|nr:polysaccharide deacetylase family protein [Sphingomonadaceae bacterium OTU29THOMA1]
MSASRRSMAIHAGTAVAAILGVTACAGPRAVATGNVATEKPVIAFTFDDIPVHGPLPPGVSRVNVMHSITDTLAAARVPASGFFNGGIGADDPGSPGTTMVWTRAGLPLGNHGFRHLSLQKAGATAFAADVIRNETSLIAVRPKGDYHWFRYPFLAEGGDPASRDTIRGMLHARGYRIAAVTMAFGDYLWNPVYAACAGKGDAAAIARLEDSFLADARRAAIASRAGAMAQAGRDIPYVLLMHAGAFDARMLPRLIALYRSMGFGFVTLAQAQSDPFYAAAMDLTKPGPTPTLATPALAGPDPKACS